MLCLIWISISKPVFDYFSQTTYLPESSASRIYSTLKLRKSGKISKSEIEQKEEKQSMPILHLCVKETVEQLGHPAGSCPYYHLAFPHRLPQGSVVLKEG